MAGEIGVGVIGFGLAARVFHAPFVSAVPGLKLEVIVERSSDEARKHYPDARILRTVEELFADQAVQLVVVGTPNETHFSLARRALEAGKHVVIDKPLAATSWEARELIDLAAQKGLVLAPFHNRRWDGDFLTVKKILAENKLGRLVSFESHFDRFRPVIREGTWKEAGNPANGMLFDLGPHLVDQALALFGKPKTLWASVRKDRDGSQIEDAFDICLRYPEYGGRGLLAWLRTSYLACDASPRFLLHGVAGSFKKFGVDPQEPALVAGAKVPRMGTDAGEDAWHQEVEDHWGTLSVAPVLTDPGHVLKTQVKTELGDYRHFYASVRDAVNGAGRLAITAEDGFEVIRMLELARVSTSEGRALDV